MRSKWLISRREFVVNGLVVGGAAALSSAVPFGLFSSCSEPGEPIRAGVIGLGRIGNKHLSCLLANRDLEVRAVCDLRDSAVADCQRGLIELGRPVPAGLTDYRRMLDREDIDLISIATPVATRAEMIRLACKAGKHVYVEAPWTGTQTESADLVKAISGSESVVWQAPVDPAWNSDRIAESISRPGAAEADSLKIAVYCSNGLPGGARTPMIDYIDLAMLIVQSAYPSKVAAVEGPSLNGLRGNGSIGVRFDFNAAGRDTVLALQVIHRARMAPEGLIVDVSVGAEGRQWQNRIQSRVNKDNDPKRISADNPCNEFLDSLGSRDAGLASGALSRWHRVNTCYHLAELALQKQSAVQFNEELL